MEQKFYTEEEVANWVSSANKNLKDKSGVTNGKVTVLKHYDKGSWFCRCHCGKIFTSIPANVKKGATKSCGCTRGIKNIEKPKEEILKQLKDTRPEYKVLTSNLSATSKWEFQCIRCSHIFLHAPAQLYSKRKRVPCKCSPSYRRSEEEWDTELQAMCDKMGYNYLGREKKEYTTFVNLYCPLHKHTWCANSKHFLNGIGCNRCGEEITTRKNKTITTESAIGVFKAKHGDRYDYSLVEYINWEDKLTIICPVHGVTYQRYCDHLKSKHGCPSCAKFGFKPDEPAYLYILSSKYKCKVGITNNKVEDRLQQINTSGKKNYKITKTILFSKGFNAKKHETHILKGLGLSFGDEDTYSGSTEVTEINNIECIMKYVQEITSE